MFLQVTVNSIIAGSIYTLLALGFTIVYGTLRFFNMAHGIAFTLGAYFCYVFRILLGIELISSIVLAVLSSAAVMVLVDRIAFRPLRIKGAPSWALVVSSIGVAMLLEAVIAFIFGSDVVSLRVGEPRPGYSFFGAYITPVQVSILVVSTLMMILLMLFLKTTRTGKAMRATTNDPEMSRIVGINTERVFLGTFTLGAAIAALAGCLIALETDLVPTMGHAALLKAIVSSIIGGVGNVSGAMFGGFVLGFVENFGIWHISAGWKNAIALILLITFILLHPAFFGMESDKR